MSDLQKYTEHKTILCVTVFIWSQQKVLLLRRADTKRVDPGKYNGIGGKVEPGESFFDAVIRETKEETGIELMPEKIRLSGIVQVPDSSNKAEWVSVIFDAYIDKQIEISPTKDGDFYWVDPKKLGEINIIEDIRDYLNEKVKNQKSTILGFCSYDGEGKILEKKINFLDLG